MRENRTYGSMRGIRRKTAKHVLRVAEGRAGVPCGGVLLYSTPFSPPKYTVPYERREMDNLSTAFPRWEIRAKNAWNYALELVDGKSLASVEVRGSGRDTELLVRARKCDYAGWGTLRADAPGRAVDPPPSPVSPSVCSDSETIRLVPLAETQIRITLFPWLLR